MGKMYDKSMDWYMKHFTQDVFIFFHRFMKIYSPLRIIVIHYAVLQFSK